MTETIDFKKYFLDIDKIEKYPISFVIKTDESRDTILNRLKADARKTYVVTKVVDDYMACIEEIINIPVLRGYLEKLKQKNMVSDVLSEIVLQSRAEFNFNEYDMD